mgnify:FL=1
MRALPMDDDEDWEDLASSNFGSRTAESVEARWKLLQGASFATFIHFVLVLTLGSCSHVRGDWDFKYESSKHHSRSCHSPPLF